jgi:hypothetical protein
MDKIYFPSGFPYLLFVNDVDGAPKFFLALSQEQALKQNQKGHTDTVKVADLVSAFGHKSTHNFLKNFGDEWMTKEGMAFFKTNKAMAM